MPKVFVIDTSSAYIYEILIKFIFVGCCDSNYTESIILFSYEDNYNSLGFLYPISLTIYCNFIYYIVD